MDTSQRKVLVKLARQARKAAEAIVKEEDLPRKMHGMCARASAILFELLQEAGFKPYICFGYGHCFLKVEDYIVDITATQFGYSKVFIVHVDELFSKLNPRDQDDATRNEGYWNNDPEDAFDSIEEAIRHQDKHDWPPEQTISRSDFI